MQTKFNISTPRLDNHSLFNSWLIVRFNVSWLSWAQQSISMHFTWSASQLENWSPNSQDLNAVYYFLWGRCNRWHIVTKLPTLISWPNLLLVPRTNLTSGSRYFHLAACPTIVGTSFRTQSVHPEWSVGPFCVTRPNPTHQLTDPTQPNQLQVEKFGPSQTQPNTNCHWLTLSLYYFFWLGFRYLSDRP